MNLDNEQKLQFKILLFKMSFKRIQNIKKVDLMRLLIHNKLIYNHDIINYYQLTEAIHHLIKLKLR